MMEAVKQHHHHKHSAVVPDGGENPITLNISSSASDPTVSASPSPSSLSSASLVSKNRHSQEEHNNLSKSQPTSGRKTKPPVVENGAKLTNAILFNNDNDNNNLSLTNHNKSYPSSDSIHKASNGFSSTIASSHQQQNNFHNHNNSNHHNQVNNTSNSYQQPSYNRYNQNYNHHQHHSMSFTPRSSSNNRGHNNSHNNHHTSHHQSNHHHHNSSYRHQKITDEAQMPNQINSSSYSMNDPATTVTSTATTSSTTNRTVDDSKSSSLGIRQINDQNQHRGAQPSGPPHYVELHVNPGECVSLQLLNGQEQIFSGPTTITMVSQQQSPPVPIPVQVPPGHMIHQIADENGTLKHIILSIMTNGDSVPSNSSVINLPQGGFRIDSRGELVCDEATSETQLTNQNEIYAADIDGCPVAPAYDATVDSSYSKDQTTIVGSSQIDTDESSAREDKTKAADAMNKDETKFISSQADANLEKDSAQCEESLDESTKSSGTHSEEREQDSDLVAKKVAEAIPDSAEKESSEAQDQAETKNSEVGDQPVDCSKDSPTENTTTSAQIDSNEGSLNSQVQLNVPTSTTDLMATSEYHQSLALGDLDYMGPNMIAPMDNQLYCYPAACCCCCYCDPMNQQEANSGAVPIERDPIAPMGEPLIPGQGIGLAHQPNAMAGYPAAQVTMMGPTMAMPPPVNDGSQLIMNGASSMTALSGQPGILNLETHGSINMPPSHKLSHGKSGRSSNSGYKQGKGHAVGQDRSFGASYGLPYSAMASSQGHQHYMSHRGEIAQNTSMGSYRSQNQAHISNQMGASSYSPGYQTFDHVTSSTGGKTPNSSDEGAIKVAKGHPHSNRHNIGNNTTYASNHNRNNTENTSDNSFMHRNNTKDHQMSYVYGQGQAANSYNMVQTSCSNSNNRHNTTESNINNGKRHQQIGAEKASVNSSNNRFSSKMGNHTDSAGHVKILGTGSHGPVSLATGNVQNRTRANKGNTHSYHARGSTNYYQNSNSPTPHESMKGLVDSQTNSHHHVPSHGTTRESSSSSRNVASKQTNAKLSHPQDSSPSKQIPSKNVACQNLSASSASCHDSPDRGHKKHDVKLISDEAPSSKDDKKPTNEPIVSESKVVIDVKSNLDESIAGPTTQRQKTASTKDSSRLSRGNPKASQAPNKQESLVASKQDEDLKGQGSRSDSVNSKKTTSPDIDKDEAASDVGAKSQLDHVEVPTRRENSPQNPEGVKNDISSKAEGKNSSRESNKQTNGKQSKARALNRDKTAGSVLVSGTDQMADNGRSVVERESENITDREAYKKASKNDQSLKVKQATSLQDVGREASPHVATNLDVKGSISHADDYLLRRRSMTDEVPQVSKKVSGSTGLQSTNNQKVGKLDCNQSTTKVGSLARTNGKRPLTSQKGVAQHSSSNGPSNQPMSSIISTNNRKSSAGNKNQRKLNDPTSNQDDRLANNPPERHQSSSNAISNNHLMNSNSAHFNKNHSSSHSYHGTHNNGHNSTHHHNHHHHNHHHHQHSKSPGQQQVKLSHLMKQCRTRIVSFVGRLVRSSLSSYSDSKFAGLLIIIFTMFAMLLAVFIHLYVVKPFTE